MTRYHGKTGVVYMSVTGTGTAISRAGLSQYTIDQSSDLAEVSAMGDSNKQYVQGLRDLKGTLSGWWDSADDYLFDAAESGDGVKMYLYPSSLAPTIYWYGPAWVNASLSVGVGGGVSISGSFAAAGDWSRKP